MCVRKEMCAKKYVSWRSSEALSCKLDIQPWKGWLLHFTLEHWNVHNIYIFVFRLNWNRYLHLSDDARIQPARFFGTIFMKYCAKYRYWLSTTDHGVTMSRWYSQYFDFPHSILTKSPSYLLCIGRHGHSSAHRSCMWLCLDWTLAIPKTWVSWNKNIKQVCGE